MEIVFSSGRKKIPLNFNRWTDVMQEKDARPFPWKANQKAVEKHHHFVKVLDMG